MGHKRQRQVGELIHEELSQVILFETQDPRLAGVTLTGVDVTADYKQARVYFTVLGDEADKKAAFIGLNSAAGFLRRALAESLSLRFVPELIFKLDTSLQKGLRVDALLDSIKAEGGMGTEESNNSANLEP
jgi:ribosome-binding factor A